jgi:hypothetical protein
VTAGGGQTDGQAQGLAPHLKQAPLSLVFSYLPHSYLLECQPSHSTTPLFLPSTIKPPSNLRQSPSVL